MTIDKDIMYFTPEMIEEQAWMMLDELADFGDIRPFALGKSGTALLVIDMQEYFTDENSHAFIPAVRAVIPGLKKLVNTCLENKIPVFATQHINNSRNAGMMDRWWSDLITKNNPGHRLCAELVHEFKRGTIIRKSQYDAFYETSLEEELKSKGITRLIITGVMTHLCCENTARSAFVRGFEVFFAVDGTATYNRQFHMSTLHNLSHGYAHPVLVSEIIESLGAENGG